MEIRDTYESQRKNLVTRLADSAPWLWEDYLRLFQFQYTYNPLYRSFCDLLHCRPEGVGSLVDIPFMPISFFKHHTVKTGDWNTALLFKSSGTTGQLRSVHHLRDESIYHQSCLRSMDSIGSPADWTWLGLLPSYIENGDSSLVEMVRYFTTLSHRAHGFFLYDFKALHERLKEAMDDQESVVLIGVSYALLDFADRYPIRLGANVRIMETGGMKGRGEELTRTQLHKRLIEAFKLKSIMSEYGMTEMMHQCYAIENGLFIAPEPVKILARDINDPLSITLGEGSGLLNVVDPGNLDTCSFIATDDLVHIHPDQSFEILGRSDNSEMRGCNLLYSDSGGPVIT